MPYQLCACGICRKVGGYSGSVNLGGIADSLRVVKGEELIKYVLPYLPTYLPPWIIHTYIRLHTYMGYEILLQMLTMSRKYSAIKDQGTPNASPCSSQRNFCSNCSTMLWLWDHQWPELIHPFASAIDTDLPVPDEMVCVMEGSKPAWVRWPEGKKSVHQLYGEDSLEGWHKKHRLFVE